MKKIRKPAVAGMFYPDEKDMLINEVDLLLELNDEAQKIDNIFGLVAPHAGYIYSGKTASIAYNLLEKSKYKKVILLSPSHREHFKGSCVYDGDYYYTPLGPVEIDAESRERFTEYSETIFAGENGHGAEHAVEVHLPFLQRALGEFLLTPIVVGDQSDEFLDELAQKIAENWDEETLVIASSDLSHFHNQTEANEKDKFVEQFIRDFDYEGLSASLVSGQCEACGGGPIIALLRAAEMCGFNKSKVLYRNDSSEAIGETDEVVGYLSAVVYGETI
ncbi:MAG: MEMO1 family protein [Melioribacteraceae bacterium]|nr:MAG: MEMO1 family protein [Melioribacteraceae bacterium]